MRKLFLATFILSAILFSGCSSTWEGVKEDSSEAWSNTKKAVNEATDD
ncbi:MAG: entericidin EcnAB [Sulfurimonas sp.]|nr:entericidin EcnAB [Sulfurimonas sp.]